MTLSQLGKWCSDRGGQLTGLFIGLTFVGWGAMNCAAGLGPPVCQTISITALETGQPLPGRWLEISGVLLRNERIIWNGRDTRETYVPLVSGQWQMLQPVAVFVRAREDYWGQPGRLLHHQEPSVAGMVDRSGMDPELEHYFIEFGMAPRPDVIILDYEAEPSTQSLLLGYIGLVTGGVILVITAVVWIIKR